MNRKKLIIIGSAVGVLILVAVVLISIMSSSGGDTDGPKTTEIPSYSTGFVCSADIQYGSITASANITKNATGLYNIELVEPALLSGMTFGFEQDNITVSYLGMTIDLPNELIPTKDAASIIVGIFDEISAPGGMLASVGESTLKVEGGGDIGDFSVEINPDDLSILKVELPNLDFSATIHNFELK